jgi:hypothetical protein
LSGLRSSPGASHPTTLEVLFDYSDYLKNEGRRADARRIASELVAGARQKLATAHPDRKKYERQYESLR